MSNFIFGGNWVDLLIILFLLFYIHDGWRKGFIELFSDLVAFVVGFTLALKLYPFAAEFLTTQFSFPISLAKAGGFLVLGLFFEQILAMFGKWIQGKLPGKISLNRLNVSLGIIPSSINAFIILAFTLPILLGLPMQPQFKQALSNSKIAGFITSRTQKLETALTVVFGDVISESLNFITIKPVSHDVVDLNFTQSELTIDEGNEYEMLALVNTARRDQGLNELVLDERLRSLARDYATEMFKGGFFSHYTPEGESPFDRMEANNINYLAAGENLALAPNITIAHQGLMDSPGHRANILSSDFGRVGIGVVDGGIYGKIFVQEFTD